MVRKISLDFVLILSVMLVVLFAFSAFAVHTNSPTSFNVNEDVSILYNITLNNTNLGGGITGNITQVNISLRGDFAFVSASNGTSVLSISTFGNTSAVLSWTNSTYFALINATDNSTNFWFNATAYTPGIYNISIITLNGTATYETNLTITVNDTTAPAVDFSSPTLGAGINVSQSSIPVNISVTDNRTIGMIRIYFYNSTMILINNTNVTGGGGSNNTALNFTGLSDGVYYINATVNDSSGNSNSTATRTITLDTVAPSISLSESSSSDSSLVIGVSIGEATSGVESCTSNRDSVSGSGSSRTVTSSSLSCGTSYSYTISCTDYAGNTGSATSSFSTDSCGSSGSGGGGGGSSSSYWKNTFSADNTQFNEGYSKELAIGSRIKFNLGSEQHTVGVVGISSSTATINVSSTPQQAIFNIGDTKKFELSGDSYYDLSVKLNGISNNKANVTIQKINEKMPETTAADDTQTGDSDANPAAEEDSLGNRNMKIILIVVVVIILLAIIVYSIKNRK